MKNFVKILFLMLMTLFIVSCSSDPRVTEVAESEAMVGMAKDKAEELMGTTQQKYDEVMEME